MAKLLNISTTLKRRSNAEKVVSWKSKCFSDKKLINFTTTDNSIPHQLNGMKIQIFVLIFRGSCL